MNKVITHLIFSIKIAKINKNAKMAKNSKRNKWMNK